MSRGSISDEKMDEDEENHAASATRSNNQDHQENQTSTIHHSEEGDGDRTVTITHHKEINSIKNKCICFLTANDFLILILCAILLARVYPPIGANYLAAEITATWIAVIIIFLLVGLCLKTQDFSKSVQRVRFNLYVQVFNFMMISGVVFGITRGVESAGILPKELSDGMVICSCLPCTVNMIFILTASAGGDEAAAVFHGVFGNILGVFLSPVLILWYVGVSGDVNVLEVFSKLALRVLIPIAIGQVLQKTSETTRDFVKEHKFAVKKLQQVCMFYIVYTVFCKTFNDGSSKNSIGDVFILIAFQFVCVSSFKTFAWFLTNILFPDEPKLRVMSLFGCVHKSVGMGVPLISAIYENDPAVGLYTLPLLIWHPMQLCIGTIVAPKLIKYVKREELRLGITTAQPSTPVMVENCRVGELSTLPVDE